jgi:hypothetical protein
LANSPAEAISLCGRDVFRNFPADDREPAVTAGIQRTFAALRARSGLRHRWSPATAPSKRKNHLPDERIGCFHREGQIRQNGTGANQMYLHLP